MSFLGYQELSQTYTATLGSGVDLVITGMASISANHPLENIFTRNLGTFCRFKSVGSQLSITVTNNDALNGDSELSGKHLSLVGILGHSLYDVDFVKVTTSYRNHVDVVQFVGVHNPVDKFNSIILGNREFSSAVPYKVVIEINVPPPGRDIDIGRLWVGPLWDTGDPSNPSNPNLINEGWVLGMAQGAKSDLTSGNQSYSNNERPFKTLDFTMEIDNDTHLMGEGINSFIEETSLLGMVNHIEGGGECIVQVRDYNGPYTTNNEQDYRWRTMVGIYAESNAANHKIKHGNADHYAVSFKLRELL